MEGAEVGREKHWTTVLVWHLCLLEEGRGGGWGGGGGGAGRRKAGEEKASDHGAVWRKSQPSAELWPEVT